MTGIGSGLHIRIYDENGSLRSTEGIHDFPCTIGRAKDCELSIPFPVISTLHAIIEKTDQGFRIRDLGSTNGIFIDGVKVRDAILQNGTRVYFGPARLEVQIEGVEPMAVMEEPAKPRPPISVSRDALIRRILICMGALSLDLAIRAWENGESLLPTFAATLTAWAAGIGLLVFTTAGLAWFFIRRFEFKRILGVAAPFALFYSGFDHAYPYLAHNLFAAQAADAFPFIWKLGFHLTLVYFVFKAVAPRTEELAFRMKMILGCFGALVLAGYLLVNRVGEQPRGFDMHTPITYPIGSFRADAYPIDNLLRDLDRSFDRVSRARNN